MDERLRFVARLLEGEKMTALCAEFGISRKIGYKIYDRYKDCGITGLSDRSRRPQRQANQLPPAIEARIVRLKREYPGWGAPKIREKLRQQVPDLPHCPAIGTVHAVLDRHGLVHRRRRRRPRTTGTELTRPLESNALWSADYKGEFMLSDRRYCYPLTITDFATRYLIACEALTTTAEKFAITVFERAFKDFGLPRAIRTDNGVPFASSWALYGLSKLAVWWLRLGIAIERIQPGHPQQNGADDDRDERERPRERPRERRRELDAARSHGLCAKAGVANAIAITKAVSSGTSERRVSGTRRLTREDTVASSIGERALARTSLVPHCAIASLFVTARRCVKEQVG